MTSAGLFAGVDEKVRKALCLKEREQLWHRRTYLDVTCVRATEIIDLVRRLYGVVETHPKLGRREPSRENWRWDLQVCVRDRNKSPEVVLERAVALLAKRGCLKAWCNQIPVASGLIDGSSDKRAAVDLARITHDRLDLYELKWNSDTPLYAAFEILQYGLAYLLCRVNQERFKYDDLDTMKVKALGLNVLAPRLYYKDRNLFWLQKGLDAGIRKLAQDLLGSDFQASFQFLALKRKPTEHFLKDGADAMASCGAELLAPGALALVRAMSKLTPPDWPARDYR
jgi:hypothetical protein